MNLLLITYNNTQNIDQDAIHQVIKNNPNTTDWWHYLPNTYIVKTADSSGKMTNIISSKFQGLLFFVIKIDLNDVNGVLAKDAWDWINKKKTVKLKLVSNSSLSPSLSKYLPPITSGQTRAMNKVLEDLLKLKKSGT